MKPEENAFLRGLFQAVGDMPLEPSDPRYVALYDARAPASQDPVELLARGVEWTPVSGVQLFSGFRGTGKSTELRRLRKRLEGAGFVVLLVDLEEYLSLSMRIDITDFLMTIAGAVGEEAGRLAPETVEGSSGWQRVLGFLKGIRLGDGEIGIEAGPPGAKIGLKANLRQDPGLRARLQERLAGHLGALVEEISSYLDETVRTLRRARGAQGVAVLVDSVDHIRGTSVNVAEVQSSVENLFAGHAHQLALPSLHVVYTVPPYLKVLHPGVSRLYSPGGVQMLQAIKVREQVAPRDPSKPGLDLVERVIRERGDWERLLGTRERLDRLALASGGHLRDLLGIVSELLRRAGSLPVDDPAVEESINQVRSEFLPIADEDAAWLGRIAETGEASLGSIDLLPRLARFLDTRLVLCYRNGNDWYDVHPLIRDEVLAQATGGT